jgi:hypothetical protein
MLSKANGIEERNRLIKQAKDCVINAISEIAHNLLQGNLPLTESQFAELKKYHNILLRLRKRTKVKTRKSLLIQSGGFLGLLIPPALSLISSLLGSYINKKINKK